MRACEQFSYEARYALTHVAAQGGGARTEVRPQPDSRCFLACRRVYSSSATLLAEEIPILADYPLFAR